MTTDRVTATNGRVLHWAARYDLLVWVLTRGRPHAFRRKLADAARLVSGESVLDVGCGTGSLALVAKALVGEAGEVFGIDPSPEMIARATSKARNSAIDVTFMSGVAEALPFDEARFDVVLSTLMFHHLPRKVRAQCAGEIARVLKPGGRVLVVDFAQGQPRHSLVAHFHRHGHVDAREIAAVLEAAGLRLINEGLVGQSSLHYVLATARP
jgi:ubiquinone/menaquinone biosynthesis C-methylase UbiE